MLGVWLAWPLCGHQWGQPASRALEQKSKAVLVLAGSGFHRQLFVFPQEISVFYFSCNYLHIDLNSPANQTWRVKRCEKLFWNTCINGGNLSKPTDRACTHPHALFGHNYWRFQGQLFERVRFLVAANTRPTPAYILSRCSLWTRALCLLPVNPRNIYLS